MDKCGNIFIGNPCPVDIPDKSLLQAKEAEGEKERAEAIEAKQEDEAAQTDRHPKREDKWADPKNSPEENCSKEQFAQDVDNMDIGREVVQTLQISTRCHEELGTPELAQLFALDSVRPSAVWEMGNVGPIRC